MSLLEILTVPNPLLRKEAEEVSGWNAEMEALVNNMAETMYHAPGVGLAANQVGVLKKIAVLDVSPPEEESQLIVLVNPRIVALEGIQKAEEGCLSVPDYRTDVERALAITVLAKNLKGEDVEIKAEGFLARVLQHEIDHLNGTTFLERIGKLKRAMYLKQRKKELKKD